jgi:uncharacterized membrane protein
VALLLLVLCGASVVRAQGVRPEPSVGAPVFGGVVLGAVGFFGGALIGHGSAGDCSGEWCDLGATALGALIGETAGVTVGAHLGNRRRGNVGLDLLAAAGMTTLGVIVLSRNDNSSAGELLLLVGAQVGATVATERATGRANERKRGLKISIAPMPHRRVGIVASIPLP